jgi:Domain of unknown function (DUF4167)
MRPGQTSRPHGRNSGNNPYRNRQKIPHGSQTRDSNGPNVKIRGNPHQIFERYVALGREASTSGDRVNTEEPLPARGAFFSSDEICQRRSSAAYHASQRADRSPNRDVGGGRIRNRWSGARLTKSAAALLVLIYPAAPLFFLRI